MEPSKELVLLHFNDAYDIQPDGKGDLGFVHFYDYVGRMREIYPEALLVFSGDAFAPSKLSRVFRGKQMARCLKMLNIDVACYGNHDFDYSPDHSLQLAKSCGFPWLLGNIKYSLTGKNLGEGLDYHIIHRGGFKIGFLGLAGPDFVGRMISDYHQKLKYKNLAEYAKTVCKRLQELSCDLIVALTHARRPADTDLAQKVPEIDLILGGHDHHSLFQVINKIPLIKSKSNFECLSVVKVFQGPVPPGSKEASIGRRWTVSSQCKQVKRATQAYPQLEAFIKKTTEEYQAFQKQKSLAQNRPKTEHPQLPQSSRMLQYGFVNNKTVVTLAAGLAAEICFAKYVAFKRKCVFAGYKLALPAANDNFIEETLNFIEAEVAAHSEVCRTAIYGPGLSSVPYLVETGNMIYLPSHLIVAITSLDQLARMLGSALERGHKCFAVLKRSAAFRDRLCARISFLEPPRQYINLIKKFKVQSIILMSCDALKGEGKAVRSGRLVDGAHLDPPSQQAAAGDVYAIFAGINHQNSMDEAVNHFSSVVKDRPESFWRAASTRLSCPFIHDLDNAIDSLESTEGSFRSCFGQEKIDYFYLLNEETWNLGLASYYLGKEYILSNFHEEKHPIQAKGVVLNQCFMSHPTYELNYGYLPILYEPSFKAKDEKILETITVYEPLLKNNEERILGVLSSEEKEYKRWLNMYRGTRLELIKPNSAKIATDHSEAELAKWITKYSPKEYQLKYLSIEQTIGCLAKRNLLFVMESESKTFVPI